MIDQEILKDFLYYGFLTRINENPGNRILNSEIISLLKDKKGKEYYEDENKIIEDGIIALKSSFSNIHGDLIIVPLSGGIDSRTVLAGLVDAGYKDRITTVTFGTPGTWDYEIGIGFAKKNKLRHKVFDLTKIKIDEKSLIETAKNGSSFTFLIDAFYNSLICKEYGKDAVYWSGFMGDNLAGSHLPKKRSNTWEEAKKNFIVKNRFVTSMNLVPSNYNPETYLPTNPILDNSIINYDDQLDVYIRQENYIRRAIIFDGYEYKTPFLNPMWINFILSLPDKYRQNTIIYKKIVYKAFPKYFSFPTVNNLGGSLSMSQNQLKIRKGLYKIKHYVQKNGSVISNLINPMRNVLGFYRELNYIDYGQAIRNREDFKLLITKNISDLKKRKIIDWLDLDSILFQHQQKNTDYGTAILLLNALEISLKALEN